MKLETTNRGFYIATGIDLYSGGYSIQDSSLAEIPAIWLGGQEGRAHLNQEMAAELIPLLQKFVDTGSIA